MPRFSFYLVSFLVLSLALITGCATPLPSTYYIADSGRVLDGPVLALAGEGDLVAAVNSDGLFVKKGDKPWTAQEVPGMKKFSRVTCLTIDEGTIYVGSDGEGLFILSEGTWEVRTSRYGGLPDDGVLSMAVDGVDEGLPGKILWVGTRKGVAAYKEGKWVNYSPDGEWLVSMTGRSGLGAGQVYVGPGFKLGRKGEDSDRFRPPVSAISAGPDRVVFGNRNSGLAIVSQDAVATIKFAEEQKVTHLKVTEEVIWAGTEAGLLWGGLKGVAKGKPWPINLVYMGWSGTLFASRDTRHFEYRWKMVGYNTAMVVDLEMEEADIWTAYRSKQGTRQSGGPKKITRDFEGSTDNPITNIRRYVNIDEYVARKQTGRHESYGLRNGLKGEPSALHLSPDGGKLWLGTTKGLWELAK